MAGDRRIFRPAAERKEWPVGARLLFGLNDDTAAIHDVDV